MSTDMRTAEIVELDIDYMLEVPCEAQDAFRAMSGCSGQGEWLIRRVIEANCTCGVRRGLLCTNCKDRTLGAIHGFPRVVCTVCHGVGPYRVLSVVAI